MKQFAVRGAVLAALGVAVAGISINSMTAADSDITIKVVMKKVNKEGLCKAINLGVAASVKEPKWDDLSSKAKELVPLAKALGKNDPPKGEKVSWKKFTDTYAQAAVDFDKACTDKDQKAAQTAAKTIANCAGCHKAHRPAQ